MSLSVRFTVAFWLGALLALLLHTHGCSPSQVQRQATALDVSARLMNRALPLWVEQYRAECSAVIDRAASYEAATAALDACNGRWSRVASAWESTRAAHSLWRAEVERCRAPDAGASCAATLDGLGANLTERARQWRCAVRALGRGDLDPLPGPTPACANDGGSP